jgi:hypothetical protein
MSLLVTNMPAEKAKSPSFFIIPLGVIFLLKRWALNYSYLSCSLSITLYCVLGRVSLNTGMTVWLLFNQIMKRMHFGIYHILQWPKLLMLFHVFVRHHLICHYNSK